MKYWEGELTKQIGGVGCPVETVDFSYLQGAKILDAGFHPKCPEGGFTIDYEKEGEKKRVVYGYNELGLWKEWNGSLGDPDELSLLLDKIDTVVNSDEWCVVDIKDDPMNRCYHFISDGKTLLTLTLRQIKMLPEEMKSPFSIQDKKIRDGAILIALGIGPVR